MPPSFRNALFLLLLASSPRVADAQELDLPIPVGATEQGALGLLMKSQHEHHGHGYRRVQGVVELRPPNLEAGRSITKLEVTFDFNCNTGQVRAVQTTRRTWTGEYAGTTYSREGWRSPVIGAEERALDHVCLRRDTASADAPPAALPAITRHRSGPQVIVMPRRAHTRERGRTRCRILEALGRRGFTSGPTLC